MKRSRTYHFYGTPSKRQKSKQVLPQSEASSAIRETKSTSPFFSLPGELKNDIYGYVLISSATLRRQSEVTQQDTELLERSRRVKAGPSKLTAHKAIYRHTVRLPKSGIAALLFTCRTIYNEAAGIFYSGNTFHFPTLAGGMQPNPRQQAYYSYLKHVSLDYSYTSLKPWTVKTGEHADTTVAHCIHELINHCPKLQTFTLHLISFPAFIHLMALAARDSSATASALASLRPRLDRLSIVAMKPLVPYPGNLIFQPQNHNTLPVEFQNSIHNCAWYSLCSSIAPWEEWHQQKKIRYWPGISADADVVEEDAFNASMEKVPDTLYETRNPPAFRRQNARFEPRRIRAWHWRRPDADGAASAEEVPWATDDGAKPSWKRLTNRRVYDSDVGDRGHPQIISCYWG